jgi:hypothetical protein
MQIPRFTTLEDARETPQGTISTGSCCVIHHWHQNMQIGDALFESKQGKFTGFCEDFFVLPAELFGFP